MEVTEMAMISFKIDDAERERIKQEARDRGISDSELIRERVIAGAALDPPADEYVKRMSAALNVSPRIVISNTILSVMAERNARQAVFGPSPAILEEFVGTQSGPLTGEEQYKRLFEERVRESENEYERLLLAEEGAGISPDEAGRTFLIKRRKGWAWFESAEFAEESRRYAEMKNLADEARASGLVPADTNTPEPVIAALYREVQAGRITPADFIAQLALKITGGRGEEARKALIARRDASKAALQAEADTRGITLDELMREREREA
jgi:hypothetical protein